MEKICSRCKLPKDIDDFSRDKNKKDGHAYVCKECQNSYMGTYYPSNKDKWKDTKVNKKRQVKANRQKFLEILMISKCTDCGNDDIRVLEFDHLADKRENVTKLISYGYSWDSIQKEIAKCEVVCCNCHRIRTIEREQSYRSIKKPRSNSGFFNFTEDFTL